MRKLLFILTFLFFSSVLFAHPGIGLVYDGKQTIYYTDLEHVWKLNTVTGVGEIALENVHTHELFLDQYGNLYGEHYWYVESEEKFKNYIWKLSSEGTFEKIREDQYGENEDFGFVRDKNFASYEIIEDGSEFQIVIRDSSATKVLHKISLNNPTWKYLTDNKELLFVDYPAVYKADANDVTMLSPDISASRIPFSIQSDEHSIYGMWTDQKSNVFVAVYAGRVVQRIDQNGKVEKVYRTNFLWSPVNGVFDSENNLWLMECRLNGKIRVVKISEDELNGGSIIWIDVIEIGLPALLLLLILYRIIRRRIRPNGIISEIID